MRKIILTLTFVLTTLVAFGSKSYLQIRDIEPKLENVTINGIPLSYADGFKSYTVINEPAFDDFFKSTAKLDAITEISNLLVIEFNNKLAKDGTTDKELYDHIDAAYYAFKKELSGLDNLKNTGLELTQSATKVKITKKMEAVKGVSQAVSNLNNISNTAPKIVEEMKKIVGIVE